MYNIGISEIKCTARYEDIDGISIKYDAEAVSRPSACSNPNCTHSGKLHLHSSNQNLLHDTKAEGKLVYINLKIRRYRCSECGKLTSDAFSFYPKKSHVTNRLRDEFITRCIKGETFNYIARDYSIDHKTVSAAFDAYVKEHHEELEYDYTPEVLGIDEAHIDEHYRLILTDIKNRRLLDMKKDNHKATVRKHLKTLDKDICECVTMDFAPGYASSVSIILPKATIVIDKYHVIQEINRCLDKVRISLQNEYKAQGVDIRRFKRSKYLFLMNWEDLTDDAESRLDEWFLEFPKLYEAYMVKETFRDIYLTIADKDVASDMFDKWLKTVPEWSEFTAMAGTMQSRKDHILNYWDYPWTNAYTESVNNIIKKIEKAGRGYKFDNLRERCLLAVNSPQPDKFNPREAIYIESRVMESLSTYSVGTTTKKKRVRAYKNKDNDLYTLFMPDFWVNVSCLDIYLEVYDRTNGIIDQAKRLEHYRNALQSIGNR